MARVDVSGIAEQINAMGVTHMVWVPDSEIGALERHLDASVRLIRACREGEAIATAAGLLIGGARPIVVCQCTGFFEAGDAFRNVVKDLELPLFLIVGHRGAQAFAAGTGDDSAARYFGPILDAWGLRYRVMGPHDDPRVIGDLYREARECGTAAAVVVSE
jgi:sulfopyruvate decarboxylase TPP-binding subunit